MRKAQLDQRKAGLGLEVHRLSDEANTLKTQLVALQQETVNARQEAIVARNDAAHTKNVLARPELEVVRKVLEIEEHASLGVANRGRGPALLKSIQMYVDGTAMEAGTDRAPFGPTLTKLFGLTALWIRWHQAEGTVEAGTEREIIMIEPGQFTPERSREFYVATDRLGFELCYCSKFGDCYWTTYHRALPTKRCE